MNAEQIAAAKERLTVVFEYYNHFNSRLAEKKIKLYSEEWKWKDKKTFLPPTFFEIEAQRNGAKTGLPPLEGFHGRFEIKPPSEDILRLKKDDLARQDKVMEVVRKRNESFDYRCGLIKAGTGVGKSILAIKISQYFEGNTLILVSNVKLLWELHKKFLEFTDMDVGIYGGGKKEIEPITICTKKSFSTDFEKIADPANRFETVIVDECHEGFSDAFRFAINKSFQRINLFGMSATPFTPELEQGDLEKYYGKVIDVKDGYDYKPEFRIIDYSPAKVSIRWTESDGYIFEDYAELRGLMAEDEIRFGHQMKELQRLYASRNAIIVLTDRIHESNMFYERLAKWDVSQFNLIKITGETNAYDDEAEIAKAKSNGKKTIIVGSIKKIGTGFDFPPADTVFLVSAIKWKSTTEQAIGRILRKHDKLNPLVVIWNDEILKGQRAEKEKTIKKVYGVKKEEIEFVRIAEQKEREKKITLTFTDITKNLP